MRWNCTTRSARIGGHLDSEIGSDATILTLTSLARHADRASALVADMIMRPRLDAVDFQRVRELRLNRLIQLRDLAPALADRAFSRLLYGNHPYGHMPLGTEPSLQSVTLDESRPFSPQHVYAVANDGHRRRGRVPRCACRVRRVGVRRVARVERSARRSILRSGRCPRVPDERLAHSASPGAAQSELRIGHVGLSRKTPDYHALLVLNTILGGQFVSRINMNLGRTRDTPTGPARRSIFDERPGPFVFTASVQSDATVDAIVESLGELDAIRGAASGDRLGALRRSRRTHPRLPAKFRNGGTD